MSGAYIAEYVSDPADGFTIILSFSAVCQAKQRSSAVRQQASEALDGAKAHAAQIRAVSVEAELRVEMKVTKAKDEHARAAEVMYGAKREVDKAAAAYQAAEENLKQLVADRHKAEKLQQHSEVLLGETLEKGIGLANQALSQVAQDASRLRKVEHMALESADIAGTKVLEVELVLEHINAEKEALQVQITNRENDIANEKEMQGRSTVSISQNQKWMEQLLVRKQTAIEQRDQAAAGIEAAQEEATAFAKEAAAVAASDGYLAAEGERAKEAHAEEAVRTWTFKHGQSEAELTKANEVCESM